MCRGTPVTDERPTAAAEVVALPSTAEPPSPAGPGDVSGELARLRDALRAERADAQAARLAMEGYLRGAAQAAEHAATLAAERDAAAQRAAEALTILAASEFRIRTLEAECARQGEALAALETALAAAQAAEAAAESAAAHARAAHARECAAAAERARGAALAGSANAAARLAQGEALAAAETTRRAADATLAQLHAEAEQLRVQCRAQGAERARLEADLAHAVAECRAVRTACAALRREREMLWRHAEALLVRCADAGLRVEAAVAARDAALGERDALRGAVDGARQATDAAAVRAVTAEQALAAATARIEGLAADARTLMDRCTQLGGRLSESEARGLALADAAAAADQRAEAARAAEARAQAALAEREAASARALGQLRETLAAREVALREALDAGATAAARLDALASERDGLAARLAELAAAQEALAAELTDGAARLAILSGERDEALAAATREAQDHAATREMLATRTAEQRAERRDAAAALDEAVAEIGVLRDQLAARERALHAAGNAAAERDAARAQLAALGDDPAALLPRCTAAEAARAELAAELERVRDAAQLLERDGDETRERADRLEAGILAAQQTERELRSELAALAERLATAEAAADGHALAERLAAAERAAELARERQARLQEQALELQQQLLDDEGRFAGLAVERDEAVRAREMLGAELAAAREAAAAHERERRAADARGQALEERLVSAERERDELQAQLASLAAIRDALQSERADLQRRLRSAEEAEHYKDEVARLQARLDEVERQQADAAQRHSQAVGLYMLELNQRSEALHQRDLELQRLTEQLRIVEAAVEDGTDQIARLRGERDRLADALGDPAVPRDADTSAPPSAAADGVEDDAGLEAAAAAALAVIAGAESVATEPETARPSTVTELRPADRAATVTPLRPPARRADGPRRVVHVEDHALLREALRGEVERWPGLSYVAHGPDGGDAEGAALLVVNLLARECDPLATICDGRWAPQEPRAFIYFATGGRGIVGGMMDVIPHPFSPDECATRLLGRPGGTQRLLMVSDKIELMNDIRTVLNRVQCSTSVALDGRQAFDLVGMVKPDAILIDLTVPRAEGVRLIARLRAEPKTARLPIILALGEPLDLGAFRADATRILTEARLTPQDLTTGVGQVLGEWHTEHSQMRATA